MDGVSVFLAMPAYKPLEAATAVSLLDTATVLAREGITLYREIKGGDCYIDRARCLLADAFLRSKATHLFMIDADMTWRPGDFLRVLSLATKMPCVAAAYSLKQDREGYAVNMVKGSKANEHECLPVVSLGLGFCCVQRGIVEEMARHVPRLRTGVSQLFKCDEIDGCYRGEDVYFFARMAEVGHRPHVALGVDLGHLGVKEYRGSGARMLDIVEAA